MRSAFSRLLDFFRSNDSPKPPRSHKARAKKPTTLGVLRMLAEGIINPRFLYAQGIDRAL